MELKLSRHLCVYLDILGGSSIFTNENRYASEVFLSLVSEFRRRLNGMSSDRVPVATVFGDSMVVAMPTRPRRNLEARVLGLLVEIADQIVNFIEAGFLVRGAITVGPFQQDTGIVFGPAYLKAVNTERTTVYPRVVIDPSVIRLLPAEYRNRVLYTAPDQVVSLNYLSNKFWLKNFHRVMIETGLDQYHDQPHIQAKYEWLRIYHDHVERKLDKVGLGQFPQGFS